MSEIIYTPTINNSTNTVGEIFRIQLTMIEPISVLNNIVFSISPTETLTEYHIKEIRWSFDGINYSSWIIVPTDFTQISTILNSQIANVFFEFRFTRVSAFPVTITLNSVQIIYTKQVIPENICPITCANPCLFPTEEIGRCSKEYNSCAGITVACDSTIFRLNDYAGALACLYENMANATGAMISWNVYYFQVKQSEKSRDIILHEYTLHNVVSAKMLPIIVPNNEFPSEEIQYSSFDMGFSEDFEIQIMKNAFENAFGITERPGQRDFLYFPIQNRLWEVHSTYLSKGDFMQFGTYYKAKLYKWQDKKNVARDVPTDAIINNIATNFEELFREEEKDEFDRVTHPMQYKTITIGDGDHIRKSILEDLSISDTEIDNYFTRVTKNVYVMHSITQHNITAVEYRLLCNISSVSNLSISFWFRYTKTNFTNTVNFDTILNAIDNNVGISLSAKYNTTSLNEFELVLNTDTYTFDGLPTLVRNEWYGFVLNISNVYGTMDFKIWKIAYDVNNPTPNTMTTKLILLYTKSLSYMPVSFASNVPYKLMSGLYEISNIRLWSQPIKEENQSIILNQYTVKDSHNLLLADNAMRPFIMNKIKPR
jgi:hypothetical protein